MRLVYTALRLLAPGHSVDTMYTIAIGTSQVDPTHTSEKTRTVSLDGTSETDLRRLDVGWSITTTDLAGTANDEFLEFWHSVAGGEPFTFDPYAIATPIAPRNAEILSDSLRPIRLGTTQRFAYSFEIREI